MATATGSAALSRCDRRDAHPSLDEHISGRYVAGFFDGYTEAGTIAPPTVASRTSNIEETWRVRAYARDAGWT